jgi:hypothetical protein
LHEKSQGRHRALLLGQLELEQKLASLVEDAYRLTLDERQLLRSTRPIRDPLDVIEARIQGGLVEAAMEDD